MRTLQQHFDQNPRATITIHGDVVTQEAVEKTPSQAVLVVINSARSSGRNSFENLLQLSIARQKAALAGSDEITTKLVSQATPPKAAGHM